MTKSLSLDSASASKLNLRKLLNAGEFVKATTSAEGSGVGSGVGSATITRRANARRATLAAEDALSSSPKDNMSGR